MSIDHLKQSVSLGIDTALVRPANSSVRGAGRQCGVCESSVRNGAKWRRLPRGTHLPDVRQALGCLYGGLVGLEEGDYLCTDRLCLYNTWLAFCQTTLLEANCEYALRSVQCTE